MGALCSKQQGTKDKKDYKPGGSKVEKKTEKSKGK